MSRKRRCSRPGETEIKQPQKAHNGATLEGCILPPARQGVNESEHCMTQVCFVCSFPNPPSATDVILNPPHPTEVLWCWSSLPMPSHKEVVFYAQIRCKRGVLTPGDHHMHGTLLECPFPSVVSALCRKTSWPLFAVRNGSRRLASTIPDLSLPACSKTCIEANSCSFGLHMILITGCSAQFSTD